jgi:hypothetical protein
VHSVVKLSQGQEGHKAGGAPEIKGYSQEYLHASSPRRKKIEEAQPGADLVRRRQTARSPSNRLVKQSICCTNAVLNAHWDTVEHPKTTP